MSTIRKEIEVKARLQNPQAFTRALEAAGVWLSAPVEQRDVIFVDADYGDFTAFHPGKNVLRIRSSNGPSFFTLKQPQENELDAIEHETEVADPAELREALACMGYAPVVEVVKTRRKASLEGCELCVDEVKGLGWFVEVEKITDEEDAGTVQEELFRLLERFGVRREDRVTRGYDTLLFLQRHGRREA